MNSEAKPDQSPAGQALFQVIFRGKLMSGFSSEAVCANLAAQFRIELSRAQSLIAQPKWVVKAGVSKEHAQKIQEVMRAAGLMVAVMSDDVAPAASVNAAPGAVTQASPPTSPAVISPAVPAPRPVAPASAPPAAAPAVFSSAPLSAELAQTPLATRAATAEFAPDLSAFSLADVGAVMDKSGPKKADRSYDLSQFSLAAVGAQIVEKPIVQAKAIDTSAMALVPAELGKAERLAPLWRDLES
jgi:hypothetical protein